MSIFTEVFIWLTLIYIVFKMPSNPMPVALDKLHIVNNNLIVTMEELRKVNDNLEDIIIGIQNILDK